jgi:hypothetical protein
VAFNYSLSLLMTLKLMCLLQMTASATPKYG